MHTRIILRYFSICRSEHTKWFGRIPCSFSLWSVYLLLVLRFRFWREKTSYYRHTLQRHSLLSSYLSLPLPALHTPLTPSSFSPSSFPRRPLLRPIHFFFTPNIWHLTHYLLIRTSPSFGIPRPATPCLSVSTVCVSAWTTHIFFSFFFPASMMETSKLWWPSFFITKYTRIRISHFSHSLTGSIITPFRSVVRWVYIGTSRITHMAHIYYPDKSTSLQA